LKLEYYGIRNKAYHNLMKSYLTNRVIVH